MSESNETGGEEIRGGIRDVSARSLTIRQGGARSVTAHAVTMRQGGIARADAQEIALTQGGVALATTEKLHVTAGAAGAVLAERAAPADENRPSASLAPSALPAAYGAYASVGLSVAA